jgi:hypothetical protein
MVPCIWKKMFEHVQTSRYQDELFRTSHSLTAAFCSFFLHHFFKCWFPLHVDVRPTPVSSMCSTRCSLPLPSR